MTPKLATHIAIAGSRFAPTPGTAIQVWWGGQWVTTSVETSKGDTLWARVIDYQGRSGVVRFRNKPRSQQQWRVLPNGSGEPPSASR